MADLQELNLVRALVTERRRALRILDAGLPIERARLEQAIAQELGADLGRNAEERQRTMTVGLSRNEPYLRLLEKVEQARTELERAEIHLRAQEDVLRERHYDILDRLAVALGDGGEAGSNSARVAAALESLVDRALPRLIEATARRG